ncbi:D-alanine--poly(phosphoribitol) ligase subunit DltC [Streptococcus hillyeri]|uniref:D-alanyl carrier protein n=1 Tax=Streptococcus hillyeri TaxID=2282420 RepID=A0A3L9DT07_9STRE|nr:D-alanine--poly(phosphoribitol) ligase subunit DltC [Streptococcus hillyeri]RLY01860.1 D-alanine--poly(phosphoribitol) ligase subunit DltC [Streptococcus hillyeri]
MDIKTEVLAIIDDLFMEDASEILDEDLYDAGILDSLGTVELIVNLEDRFGIVVPVSELGREDWNTVNKIVAGIEGLRHD